MCRLQTFCYHQGPNLAEYVDSTASLDTWLSPAVGRRSGGRNSLLFPMSGILVMKL